MEMDMKMLQELVKTVLLANDGLCCDNETERTKLAYEISLEILLNTQTMVTKANSKYNTPYNSPYLKSF